ncbi:hypothetical protein [Actinoplanes sp. GCM10030250]|uniref:hypothetical protein n=1 Tax=Actinoplanes sp. GCM10030250 TaxID=3273376 RepID=UPI00361B647E
MIVRRFLILLLFVLAPLPVAASPAWACSCAANTGLDEAELAFVGVAEAVRESKGVNRVVFGVESVIKGDASTEVSLTTSDNEASCGYRFDEGGRYRVYAVAGETSLCSGNELLTPTPASTARAERVSTERTTIFWTGSGIVLLMVVAGLTWLFRQPRQH